MCCFIPLYVISIDLIAVENIYMNFHVQNFLKILMPVHIYFKKCSNIEYDKRIILLILREILSELKFWKRKQLDFTWTEIFLDKGKNCSSLFIDVELWEALLFVFWYKLNLEWLTLPWFNFIPNNCKKCVQSCTEYRTGCNKLPQLIQNVCKNTGNRT